MIARVLFCAVTVLGVTAAAEPVSPFAFRDLELAVARTARHGVSHEQLQAMADHDAAHGLEAGQNVLACGPYAKAAALRQAIEGALEASHFHPVYFSKSAGRACFAVSSYAEAAQVRAALAHLGEEITVSRIPHALKVDASVAEVSQSLKSGERFSLELMFGLGMGGKGLHAARPSAAVTAEIIASGRALLADPAKRRGALSQFFWSSRSGGALEGHALSQVFSQHADSALRCGFDEMHMDMGRTSVALTSARGADPACLLLLASASALHQDVSLVLAHKGHALHSSAAPAGISAVSADPEPYDDATPATDQNAFVQSGNSVDTPYSDIGINGTSYVVGYIDSGADDLSCFLIDNTGTITPRTPGNDYANPITQHWRRKVIQYISWADGSPAIGYDHGTWCTGSTAGKCINDTSSGNAYNGVAPGAKVTMFDVDVAETDNFVNVPSLYDICLPPAYGAGARIHSDSWGTPGMTSQTSKSLDVDQFTYENPDFLFIVAASNDGMDGYKSVGSPGVSKNALTVGATASDHDELVYFSSVGPTYDGSIKPDIVAPGQNLMSAGVRFDNETDSCNVQLSSGTSMATPITAGSAVLVRQYLEDPDYWAQTCNPSYDSCPTVNPDKPGNFISGALLKAAIVHSGEPIHYHQGFPGGSTIPAGNLSSPPPDVFQGWGQVLLKNLLPVAGTYDFDLYVADYQPISSLQARYFFVDVTDTSLPLRATISWTDPANTVWAAKNLLNDLDLIILTPKGYYYYGNNIEGDEHNPTERFVQAPGEDIETGVYTVIVVAKQLATDSQDFSIVITCIGEVQEDRTYTAEAYLPTELNYENATEACQGTYGAPTGNVLVRFQLEDWQSGESWQGLDFLVRDEDDKTTLSTCTFTQNSDVMAAPYTRSSQCTACLPDDTTYLAKFDTSDASSDGSNLVRVASTQCDNVFLSSRQEQAYFSLSGGSCNYCPSGYTRMLALMKANVTDDDYVDYTWYGLAYWTIAMSSDASKIIYTGTLTISDEEADRYCIANGEYTVTLSDSALYDETSRNAEVTFSAVSGGESVVLSGRAGVLTGTISFGQEEETWYQMGTMGAPKGASTAFGASIAASDGMLAVGAPDEMGTVTIYESTTALTTFGSPNPTSVQQFGFSVALAKDFVVVGAPGDDMMATENGMAYIFKLENSGGKLKVELDASFMPMGLTAYSRYGHSVAIYYGSDDVNVPENSLSEWVAIGAPGLNETGMVFVYVRLDEEDGWDLLGEVWAPPTTNAEDFGRAVSWYNDYMAVSGVNNETAIGFVAIYENAYPSIPQFITTLYAEQAMAGNEFGYSLSLYRAGAAANFGYALGVGAPAINTAYIFVNNPLVNVWTQISVLVAPTSNPLDTAAMFGFSISVNEDAVLVGSPGFGGYSGRVLAYLAQNESDMNPPISWAQQAVLVPSGSTGGDMFGAALVVSGDRAVVGAPGVNGGKGAFVAYIESTSAAPTPAPSSKSNSDDDDGWSNLDSFNSLAILLLVLGLVFIVGVGAVVYFRFGKDSSLKDPFLSNQH